MKFLPISACIVCCAAAGAAAQSDRTQTFTGTITDSECATANHSLMRMGDTDAECVQMCVDAHGATYLLFDGKTAFQLSDQKTPAAFAGKKVSVTGTLDEKTHTITVKTIAASR